VHVPSSFANYRRQTNSDFADAFVATLEIVAGTREVLTSSLEIPEIPSNILPALTAFAGAIAIGMHADGFGSFYNSVLEMQANIKNQMISGPR
jgi:hypothetical protein